MDGIGGTIKNAVFRQVKPRKVVINSLIEFYESANKFAPSIKCFYQPDSSLLEEPHDIENAPVIYLTHYKYIDWLEKMKKMAKHLSAFLAFPATLIQFALKITKIISNVDILKQNFNHLQ